MTPREPDSEIIRKALMMRDAGYDIAETFDWEALGRLLKDYDDKRARVAFLERTK